MCDLSFLIDYIKSFSFTKYDIDGIVLVVGKIRVLRPPTNVLVSNYLLSGVRFQPRRMPPLAINTYYHTFARTSQMFRAPFFIQILFLSTAASEDRI